MSNAGKTFTTGLTFDEYAADLRVHHKEFAEYYERLTEIVSELRDGSLFANVRTLAIVEDWCPDCVFNVPIVARFIEASRQASLRIVRRAECRPLADNFPGRGGVSRIPTFVFLDSTDNVIGHWSERCTSSQRWFDQFTRHHPMPELDIRDGIPAPPLLDWMKLRISLEREQFYRGVWRDVLAEIRAVLRRLAE
ncbi:MAG: thioredoxin family protein [Verrucomicrobia bacterium]|nr:thioredoxin family protein [Verrucomicrobiota bacterium]